MRADLKKFFSKWKRVDIVLLIISVCVVTFLTYFPLLYAYLSTPAGAVFSGEASFFEPVDTNLYASAIHFGQWGGILLPNLYTSIPNTPVLIYPFLTIIGFIFRSINPFLLFYLFGILMEIVLFIGLVFISNKLGFSIKMSLFAAVVTCLGGGFGFIYFPNIIPADFTYTHPTFAITLQKPHEALAVLSFIFALTYLYFYMLRKKQSFRKYVLPVLIPLLISIFIYPFFAISFFLISGIFLLIQRKMSLLKQDIFAFLLLLLSSGLVVGLLAVQFVINPTYLGISSHIGTDILSEVLGYGILIPIFIFQFFWLPKSPIKTFLSIWFGVTFLLTILPIGPGAVFSRGSFFPIILLSMLVLQQLEFHVTSTVKYALYLGFFVLLLATSLRIFYIRMTYNYALNPYFSIPREEYGIFTFLNTHAPAKSSILAMYTTSNEIPALTHNAVYLGHGLQTPGAASKMEAVQKFYAGKDTLAEAKVFLLTNNISYVVWGIEEKTYYELHASNENHLKEIFSRLHVVYFNKGIAVLSVDKKSLRSIPSNL